jgi:Transmembrane secretion effector
MVGYAVYTISIVWLAYSISHNFLDVGAVLFIEYACYTATFLTGPVVDRVRNQRTIFLASYPIQAAAAATIGLGVVYGFLSVGLLFALVAVISILWDMTWAAINAAPGVLLSPDQQFAASGVTGAIGGVLTIVGYAVGGVLILVVGADGGMFLYSALLLTGAALAIPLLITPPAGPPTSFSESFREGWQLVASGTGRPLLQLAALDSIQGFLASAAPILITLLATATYHESATGYGVLFTAFVVGGVVAGLLLGHWNPRGKVGLIMAGALAAAGAAYLTAVAVPSLLILGALAWFAVGFASSAYLDAKYAFFRGSVAPEKVGRLFANMYLFPGITSSIGALVISALAVNGAPVELGVVIGLGFLAVGALGLALPGVRKMRY